MNSLLTILIGGVNDLMVLMSDSVDLLDMEEELEIMTTNSIAPFWTGWSGLTELLLRFAINTIVVAIIVQFFYYPKSKRREYYFTFTLIAVSVFMLIYLMGGVKLKIGFALGLFAIFGIIKYRTEQVPIREMTYLFIIIAVSAINGLATSISYFELTVTNLIFLCALAVCENTRWVKHVATKIVTYDNISLISPEKEDELKDDLEKRTGLTIIRIEVGNIDFLKDSAILKIYYEPVMDEFGTIDNVNKGGKKF